METNLLLFSIILAIGTALAIKDVYVKAGAGKSWWQAGLNWIFLTGMIFAGYLSLPFIFGAVLQVIGSVSPIMQVIMIVLMTGVAVGTIHHLVVKRMSGFPAVVLHTVNIMAMLYFTYFVVDMTTGVFKSPRPVFWQSHAMIAVFAAYFGYQLIRYWEAGGRELWGIAITYVIDCVLIAGLGIFLGHSVIGSMEGSLMFFIPLLGFHFLLFWLFFGMGDPKAKRRFSRFIITILTLVIFVIYGGLLYLQVAGKMEQAEVVAAAKYNEWQHAQSKLDHEVVFVESGAREASQEAQRYQELARQELAKPKPNMDLVKRYQDMAKVAGERIKAGHDNQAGMGRPENVLPEEAQNLLDATFSAPGRAVEAVKGVFSGSAAPAPATIPAGRPITIPPGQIIDVGEVKKGQKWRFSYYSGYFESRVDKGDGKATWDHVSNHRPFHSGCDGKLQVRAFGSPVEIWVMGL